MTSISNSNNQQKQQQQQQPQASICVASIAAQPAALQL